MNKLIKSLYLYYFNIHTSLKGMPWPAIKRICKNNKLWKDVKWNVNFGLYKEINNVR